MTISTQKSADTRWDMFRARVRRLVFKYFTVQTVGILLLILSVGSGFYGHWVTFGELTWAQLTTEFYANVSSEFFSVAITVLIIDAISQRRQREENKQRYIRQMRSTERSLAMAAVVELRELDAIKDGSLKDANIENANLHGVKLGNADLQYAHMDFADLSDSFLYFVKLRGADMSGVNLQRATLSMADMRDVNLVAASLEGALLNGADLTNAKLDNAKFDENTLLPNGDRWTPTIDMRRFTDPRHAVYWRSDMPESPAYHGQRGATSE